MSVATIQIQLFQYLKNKLPEQASVVDEVSKLLDISTDSAYRRIRGEKALTIEELYKLCVHYRLSLDSLLNLQSDAFLFSGSFVQAENFKFEDYLTNAVQHVKYMNSFKERKFFYLCKDISG
jgi:plasmid maintenance system antidote protein VapI